MKATIIIALDSSTIFTNNFLFFLHSYSTIENYELIFTSDGNKEIHYETLIKKYFNDYKYIEHQEKQGYGIVNNIAASYATTNFLIFMNADIILSSGCLENMLSTLSKKNIDAVQPLLIYPQNMTVQSTGHVFCKNYNTHLLEGRNINDSIVRTPGYRSAFTTALCVVKKEIFNKYHGFNEIYFNAWEGMELGLKITSNGGKCLYEPTAIAYHIRGGGRGQYKIDETSQTAYFWTTWGNIISEDISTYLAKQLETVAKEKEYYIINFSNIRNIKDIISKLNLKIIDSTEYTEISGYSQIEFFKTLPYSFANLDSGIIYIANNFRVINNNKLWFSLRRNHSDLMIDLSGNCININ